MKKLLLIIGIAAGLAACQNADQKTGQALKKDKTANDTASYTTLQWLDSTVKDLGKVKEGQVVEVAYRFKNTGDKNLVIQNVSASCGCTIPERPEKPFAPGEEGTIRAKFDSKGRPHGEARKEVFVNANTRPQQQHALSFKVEITD